MDASSIITVSGINVQVVRKDIKNLHLAVYPPDGHVRVAVPTHVTDDNVRLAVISKLNWIKAQQKDFKDQPRQSEREFISGECHYFFGKRYRLELIERNGKPEVKQLKSGKLKLFVKPDASVEAKEKVISSWYRQQLKEMIPTLLEVWQPIVGQTAKDWGIRKMRTKWGSCNIDQRRIWLNLELAKKPIECLEYILVHELIHLHERNHNARFKQHLDRALPNWRARQALLNKAPLQHENWTY
jgi:predicted metal-dependent hydrolase